MTRLPLRFSACILFVLMSAGSWAPAQEAPAESPEARPLDLATESLPRAVSQLPYEFRLEARGGTPPLHWRVASGVLPAGLELDAKQGRIYGIPAVTGEFRLSLSVTDSATPAQGRERVFFLQVVAPLELFWEGKPAVRTDRIEGSVKVSNNTPDEFDFTLIVVAVNEIGKAFALGYQHGPMPAETEGKSFPFGEINDLPRGRYVVHVDAVAEVPARKAIYRARLQTGPLQVP